MKLPSTIRFLDDDIKKAFYKLENGDDSEKDLFRLMNQAMNNIEQNAFCGIQLPKRLIPLAYTKCKVNLKSIHFILAFCKGSLAFGVASFAFQRTTIRQKFPLQFPFCSL